jgi:hypothetical protein
VTSLYVLRPQADADLGEHAWYRQNKQILNSVINSCLRLTKRLRSWLLILKWADAFVSTGRSSIQLECSGSRASEKMLVLYLPTDSGIEIVRLLHGSRNLDLLLIE